MLLSEPLRDEIYSYIHGDVLKTCPVFRAFENSFINPLSRTLDIETFGPGDNVIEEGEMSSKMFFIQNGTVDIFHQATKSSFKELQVGDYFGEISFFTGKPRCASAKCLDYVDLLSLTRANMNHILEKFPEASEKTIALSNKCQEEDYSSL